MKRVTVNVTRVAFALMLVLLLTVRVELQAQTHTTQAFFPLVTSSGGCHREAGMSNWKIIVPEITTNKALNPSGEIAGNFAATGAGTVTRVTTRSKYGLYSYRVETGANADGMTETLATLANAIHHVTVRVNDAGLASSWSWSLNGVDNTIPTFVRSIDDTWSIYKVSFPAVQANGSALLYMRQNGAGALDINIDGIQVEETDGYFTTFCDGDQPGCEWLGSAHASASQRSAQSRAGGRIRDLKDDFGFGVDNFMNTGMPVQSTEIDNYALLAGGQLNDIKVEPREFTLMGILSPTKTDPACASTLDQLRAALEEELAHDRYPKGDDGWQPVLIRYAGATVDKEIAAHYSGGLEGRIDVDNQIHEGFGLRFSAPNPHWLEIGQSAQLLDTEDSATFQQIAGRLRSTGQWDNLNAGAPTSSVVVRTAVIGPDKKLYIGGEFDDWDGVAGADNIARYNFQTGLWELVGNAADVTDTVWSMVFAPDNDTLFFGGEFSNAGGDANADFLAQYSIASDTISAVAAGGTSFVVGMAIGTDGVLYFCGGFLNWDGIANADFIASWDGSAYAALGTAGNDTINAVDVRTSDGHVFAVGLFTSIGGSSINRAAEWDGSAWAALGSGLDNLAIAVRVDQRTGNAYIGGAFSTADGQAAEKIALWNKTTFEPLGEGVNATVTFISIGPDGMVYVTGDFTAAGGKFANRMAKWNGSSWGHLDIDLPGAPVGRVFVTGDPDPVTLANYDQFVGYDTTGSGDFAGTASAVNEGTAHAFPEFIAQRVGGTSARLETLRNETLGRELLYNYPLLDGETLTTDNDPLSQSIESSFSGSRLDATLAGDDFGDWSLQPGSNQVTSFVDNDGATVVGYLLWRDAYKGHAD